MLPAICPTLVVASSLMAYGIAINPTSTYIEQTASITASAISSRCRPRKHQIEYREGLQPGSYLAILSPSTSHMVEASAGEGACGNDHPRQASWQA